MDGLSACMIRLGKQFLESEQSQRLEHFSLRSHYIALKSVDKQADALPLGH